MKIIAFEGLDKSGKASQTKLLTAFLETAGHRVVQSEFHRYDTPTGKLVMEWLAGRYEASQQTIELIMTADKQAQQEWFVQLEEEGTDFLILDRYTTSQKVYSRANGISAMWTGVLQNYMRMPDVEVYIDIPPEESMKRKGKHNDGVNDRYESDLKLLTQARELFLLSNAIKIDGMQPVEKVHYDILKSLQKHLKI